MSSASATTYLSHDCLYNSPMDCGNITTQSNRSLSQILQKYNEILSSSFCATPTDGSNCHYAVNDLSNAYSTFYPAYQREANKAKVELPNKRKELTNSVNEYEKQVATNDAYKNPIQEMYDSSIYTNTLWAVLGTTVLFYVFNKMAKSS